MAAETCHNRLPLQEIVHKRLPLHRFSATNVFRYIEPLVPSAASATSGCLSRPVASVAQGSPAAWPLGCPVALKVSAFWALSVAARVAGRFGCLGRAGRPRPSCRFAAFASAAFPMLSENVIMSFGRSRGAEGCVWRYGGSALHERRGGSLAGTSGTYQVQHAQRARRFQHDQGTQSAPRAQVLGAHASNASSARSTKRPAIRCGHAAKRKGLP